MSLSPQRRPPCGQTNNRPVNWLGGCFNQKDTTIDGVKIKRNVTLMKDYKPVPDYTASGVDPYEFANSNGPGTVIDCSPYWPGDPVYYECGETGGAGNGSLPCGIPEATDIMPCGGSPTQSFSDGLGIYHNCYVQTEETKSFSSCRNVGFKNAFAYKTHFGRLSYTSRQWMQQDIFDWCNCGYGDGARTHQYDPEPDDVRYLSMTANSSFSRTVYEWCINTFQNGTFDCGDGPTPNCCTALGSLIGTSTNTGNASNAVHVNRYSGDFFVDTCSSSSTCPTVTLGSCDTSACTDPCCTSPSPSCCCPCTPTPTSATARDPDDIYNNLAGNAQEAFEMLAMANGNILDVLTLWNPYFCGIDFTDCRCTVSGGGSAWTITYQAQRSCPVGACDSTTEWVTVLVISIDTVAGTVDSHDYEPDMRGFLGCPTDATCPPMDNFHHTHIQFTPTSFSYTLDAEGANSVSLWEVNHTEVNGTLGTPYTGQECFDDCVALLANLPLDKDEILPWRQDTNVSMGPLVHYDEGHGALQPYVSTCESQTGSLGSEYIFGIPGPEGIDHVWNPKHPNYCICTDDLSCQGAYIKSRGAWNDEIGGGSPTEWTDRFQASANTMQGGFVNNFGWVIPGTCNTDVDCGPRPSPTYFMGKYAEIIFNKQSFNYARPCGADRFSISESSVRCVTGSADNILVLDSTFGSPTDIQTDDYVKVCGVSGLEGIWTVQSRDSDYQLTLKEPRLISASLLPPLPYEDCGDGIVARLRFQGGGNLLPAICGKIDISSITSISGSVTCSLSDSPYLIDGDLVKIDSAIGGNINGNWHVLVIDSQTVGLIGAVFDPDNPYLGHGLMYSPFAADWKWNDVGSKGDFTVLTYKYDYRTPGEYNRIQSAIDFNSGYGVCSLTDTMGCQAGCGSPGTAPAATAIPIPRSGSCYAPEIEEVTCRTECLPFNACSPNVAFFSPNNETFKNEGSTVQAAKNLGFAAYDDVKMDTQYGCQWQGGIKQTISDPLWVRPVCPCVPIFDPDTEVLQGYSCDCIVRADDGSCPSDQPKTEDQPCIKWVPAPSLYEARCEVPEGAPAFVGGLGTPLGCLKVTNLDCDSGNICYPPQSDGCGWFPSQCGDGCGCNAVAAWQTPWIDYVTRIQEVCDDCRFSPDYIANGFLCDQELFVTPP